MDTTQRITTQCDADKRLIYQDLEDDNRASIKKLQFEYFMYLYHNGDDELTRAVIKAIDFWEEKKKAIIELWDKIKEISCQSIEPLSKSFMADYRRAWEKNFNNYRKLHALPLKRRLRCRWRHRESRSLVGISQDAVMIDEYAFIEPGLNSF